MGTMVRMQIHAYDCSSIFEQHIDTKNDLKRKVLLVQQQNWIFNE